MAVKARVSCWSSLGALMARSRLADPTTWPWEPSPTFWAQGSSALLTPIPLPNLSNMQPNFPKWIVITVICAYSSRPFVGGFRCERLCIFFSGALWFENWSHGALIDQLLVGLVFNNVIPSLIFSQIQLYFTAKADCSVSRVHLNLLFVLIVYVTRFIS